MNLLAERGGLSAHMPLGIVPARHGGPDLNDIAAFLDASNLPEASHSTSPTDIVIIAAAWAGLIVMFYFPAIQVLSVIAIATALGIRGAIRKSRGILFPQDAGPAHSRAPV